MEKRLLNVNDLSEYLSMPVPTVYTYVSIGRIPPTCIRRIGRALRFEKLAIDRWVSDESANRGIHAESGQ